MVKEYLQHHGSHDQSSHGNWAVRKDLINRADGGVIKAGTKVGRMTSAQNETNSGRAYVTEKTGQSIVEKEMIDMYKNYMRWKTYDKASPELQKKYDETKQIPLYQMDMTTKVDLVLPSMKEKGEIFCKKILGSEKAQWQVAEAYDAEKNGKTDWSKYSKAEKEDILSDTKDSLERAAINYKKNGFELIDDGPYTSADSIKYSSVYDGYRIFIASLNDRKVMNIYKAELAKKGYNAVSDDYDAMDAKSLSVNKMLKRQDTLNRTTGLFSVFTASGRNKIAERDELAKILKDPIDQKRKYGIWLTENRELRKRFAGNGLIIFERDGALEVNQSYEVVD